MAELATAFPEKNLTNNKVFVSSKRQNRRGEVLSNKDSRLREWEVRPHGRGFCKVLIPV